MGALEEAHDEAFEAGFKAGCKVHDGSYHESWMQDALLEWRVGQPAPAAPRVPNWFVVDSEEKAVEMFGAGSRMHGTWLQWGVFQVDLNAFEPVLDFPPPTERDLGVALCGFEDEHLDEIDLDELDLDVPIPYVPAPSPTLPGLAPSYVPSGPPCPICQGRGR